MVLINKVAVCLLCLCLGCESSVQEIIRPERIVSKRQMVYDQNSYEILKDKWKEYNDVYPSEDAYANWMYAARYAGDAQYEQLLEKGLEQYPANPTLLYLKGILHLGLADDTRGMEMLERAAELDPAYMDPWFGLVTHYLQNSPDKFRVALSRILGSGIISEEIMDYSYNMLLSLKPDAVLITNGDNDTYPGWILTKILDHRPDVIIVNRSLLNTTWYPMEIIREGLPAFISESELMSLRQQVNSKMKGKTGFSAGGPYGDLLIERLIDKCEETGRPVHFATTLYLTEKVSPYFENGQGLGLSVLVTPISNDDYLRTAERMLAQWLNEYRTGGLDSWQLQYGSPSSA